MGEYLQSDVEIRNFMRIKLGRNAFSRVNIARIGNKVILTIVTHRPGFVVGKQGSEVEKLKADLSQKFGFDFEIKIEEIYRQELDPYLVCLSIANKMEKRENYKKAVKNAIKYSMKAGAGGIAIEVSGRLNGSTIARRERYIGGSPSMHTFKDHIFVYKMHVQTVYGICGVQTYVTFKGGKNVINS